MDKAYYRKLLKAHDDPVYWEFPNGWDAESYDKEEAKFQAFAQEIQDLLGGSCAVETGTDIQDASFHGQIRLPDACMTDDTVAWLRVSNFGNFATVYCSSETEIVPRYLNVIKLVMHKHGYIYIPPDILSEPYTGANQGVTGIKNWGIRYFDWV